MRYDVAGDKLARQEAVHGFFEAIRARRPEILVELRDLPVHEMEGLHLLDAPEFVRLAGWVTEHQIGKLHLVSDSLGDIELATQTDGDIELATQTEPRLEP